MSDKTARIHNHASNRAKAGAGERKAVFKSVLDSPFRIQWPSIPINVQNATLALVILKLKGISDYKHHRTQENRKRKREEQVDSQHRRQRKREDLHGETTDPSISRVGQHPYISDESSKTTSISLDPSRHLPLPNITLPPSLNQGKVVKQPETFRHIVVGINEVTKRLESQISCRRISMTGGDVLIRPPLKVVLVCRADVDPHLLVDHLPHLVAAYNSAHPLDVAKLVPLPKHAEDALARVTGLRRAAVIGLDADLPGIEDLSALLASVPILAASWLAGAGLQPLLVPTHIKQVRTSAPKDMKAAKEQRLKGKALAKQSHKSGKPPA